MLRVTCCWLRRSLFNMFPGNDLEKFLPFFFAGDFCCCCWIFLAFRSFLCTSPSDSWLFFSCRMPRLRWTLGTIRACFHVLGRREEVSVFCARGVFINRTSTTDWNAQSQMLVLPIFVGAGSAAVRPARDREDAARQGPRFQHQRDFPEGDY